MITSGLQNLRRYFELIIFQAYLQSIEPDTVQSFESFESFVESRPGKSLSPCPGVIGCSDSISHQDVREGASNR